MSLSEKALNHWESVPGYFSREEAELVYDSAKKALSEGGAAVEFGSAFGKSSGVIAEAIPEASKLYCVDVWVWGWPELEALLADKSSFIGQWYPPIPESQRGKSVNEMFLENVAQFKNIVPMWTPSVIGLNQIQDEIKFIFIDACHDYESVRQDILSAIERKIPVIALHDYNDSNHPGVSQAAWELLKRRPDRQAGSLGVWEMTYA